MSLISLDTETTGLSPKSGHRIIEIGCVELQNRKPTGRTFHYYLQPDRDIDPGAQAVHGITSEFLADKPRYEDIHEEFLAFIEGAELLIHNAPFDTRFLNHEFGLLKYKKTLDQHCNIIDSLVLARKMHPGQKNNLDALCQRYKINNKHRELHGALLDAEILASVYLAMTGGQENLFDSTGASASHQDIHQSVRRTSSTRKPLPVKKATADELTAHEAILASLDE